MIRKHSELAPEVKENIRGGSGRAVALPYVAPGEMAGLEFVTVLALEPGATIGEHPHPDAEELYLIISGAGTGVLDGERFPVDVGDAYLCKRGHTHGLECGAGGPLTFLAILSMVPE
jgi:mannose-6-phosphate isomerase-like protein (cupin superfamily)